MNTGKHLVDTTHPKHSILSKKSKSGCRKRNVSSCRFFVYILAFTTLFLGNFRTNATLFSANLQAFTTLFLGNFRINTTLFLGNFRTNTTLFLGNFHTNTTLFLGNLLIN